MSKPPPAEAPAVTPQLLRSWPLPSLGDDSTKHDRGTVLVAGSADSTPGAVLLAGLAALRVGAGRLQVATVEATAVALGVTLPEAMVVGCTDLGAVLLGRSDAETTVVLGPGLLDVDDTHRLLQQVLPALTCRGLVLTRSR